MKRILMLLGTGLNEREWAKIVSRYGHVALVQRTFVEHIETWENERLVESGPEIPVKNNRLFNEVTFGMKNMLLFFRFQKLMRPEPAEVTIAMSYSFALLALLFKLSGRTRKVVCIIVDYLPPSGNWRLRTHRRITGWISRRVAALSDEVWAISPRILTASANPRNYVMRFPVSNHHAPMAPREEIGYIGFPSADHGLEMLFEVCHRHGFKLNIIGDSPYLQSIRHLAPANTQFHGITNDPEKITPILARCFCGYAVYRNTGPQNYSYYGFPSKALHWFANNTPIVTTNTSYFTEHIVRHGVGKVVEPVADEIEKAVLDIRARFPMYYEAINSFRDSWNAEILSFHQERMSALLESK